MRLRRPGSARISWAVERSATRTSSKARRRWPSGISSTPTRVTVSTLPGSLREKESFASSPKRSDVSRVARTAPGRVIKAPRSSSPRRPSKELRKGASDRGSTPRSRRERSGSVSRETLSSRTGAAGPPRPSRTTRGKASSGSPPGPAMIWWEALPVTASVERRKAVSALSLARSMARTTATPTAIPATARKACRGCFDQ